MLTFVFDGVEGRMIASETLTSGMVGKRVQFRFSREWDGLQKTAVFAAGEVTRDVPGVWEETEIPPRVLEKPLEQLYVGIYGTNGAGDLVIPTVWVPGPVIQPGANPSGDPSTAPELPVWDRILAMIGSLENLDTEARENLVAAINEALKASRTLQPDWNQWENTRPDYIKNRTHWTRDSRESIRWDGNRQGKAVLYLPNRNSWYCRVSDRLPRSWELTGGSTLLQYSDGVVQEGITDVLSGENAILSATGRVLVVSDREFTIGEDHMTAPETGLYLWFTPQNPGNWVLQVTWGSRKTLRLEDRYVPMTVARKAETGFLLGAQSTRLLMRILQNASYKTDQTTNLDTLSWILGVSGDGAESYGPSLTGITVSYTGGEVPAGTPVAYLTGLKVLAGYSDGSWEEITGYSLSGTIREGSNTLTVIYQGQTATFAVTGTGKSQTGDAPVGYLVLLELTGCTADRANGYVTGGLPLAVRLTAEAGYTLEGARVQVTLDGGDITDQAYSEGLVTIGAVTGDVVITAEARAL